MMNELCYQVWLLVSISMIIAIMPSKSGANHAKEDYDIYKGEIHTHDDPDAAAEQERERLDLETQPVDMDNDDTLLRKLLDLKPDAAMAEFSVDRERLLLETINEVQDSSPYSWAQSVMNTAKAQGYSSASATSANKRGSPQADEEGKTRNTIEELVERYERKLIDFSRNFTRDTKEKLRCIHQLGGLTSVSELQKMIRSAGTCKLSQPCCDQQRNKMYRSIDGSCNNLGKPKQGMAQTAFRRLLPAFYEDSIQAPRGRQQAMKCIKNPTIGQFDPPTPSARLVSKKIIADKKVDKEAPLTHMVMQWGQFLDHDIDLAPEGPHEGSCDSCSIKDDCEPIEIPTGDTLRGSTADGKCINFRRSTAVCDTSGTLKPREQLNDLTSYIDGSQIYGSSKKLAEELRKKCANIRRCRSFLGQLDTSRGNLLPLRSGDQCSPQSTCFIAGDVRANEQVGLTTLHTLFLREHNRIADQLRRMNRHWNSNKVYQETRKIIGAILQKITYEDYLPSLLGNAQGIVMRPYRGYRKNVDASIPNVFATAAYRYGHSLVQPQFITYSSDRYEDDHRGRRVIQLRDSFFNINTFRKTNIAAVLRGLVTQQSLKTDESVNLVLTNQLFERPGTRAPGLDLAALNIQRGRDHGLPVYSAWRSYCKSVYPNLPNAVIDNVQTLWKMYSVYGTPEVADLFVAGLAEKDFKGSVLGPTFACIFGITFSDLRDGDRFYYKNPGVFTRSQRREVEKSSLSRIICDNTNIRKIQRNAFKYVKNRTRRIRCRQLPSVNLNMWKETNRSWQQDEQDYNDDIDEEITNTDEEIAAELMEAMEEDKDETIQDDETGHYYR